MVVLQSQTNTRQQIETAHAWAAANLPGLNARARAGELPYWDMASLLNTYLLRGLPWPGALTPDEALQILVVLSFAGSSVERHAQAQSVRRQAHAGAPPPAGPQPGKGLGALLVNRGTRFLNYFMQVAGGAGHPHHYSVRTLVELNGPGVEVRHPTRGGVLGTAGAARGDAFLTFSGHRSEIDFLVLGKTTAALQSAANGCLESLVRSGTALESAVAVEAALTASHLMQAVQARLHDFMIHRKFDLDLLREVSGYYHCPWADAALPWPFSPGADAASLLRDVMLFDCLDRAGLPDFHDQLERACGGLMPARRAALARPSLETRLMRRLGLDRLALARMGTTETQDLLTQHPWLPAYAQLYRVQRDVSRAQIDLAAKYGTSQAGEMPGAPSGRATARADVVDTSAAPGASSGRATARADVVDASAAPGASSGRATARADVVDASAGSGGIGWMLHLDEARHCHPLARLGDDPLVQPRVRAQLARLGYRERADEELLALASLCGEAARQGEVAAIDRPRQVSRQ